MWLYNKTKAPLSPTYGGFPVKLVTHFNTPIHPDNDINVDDLREKTLNSVKGLIKKHQKLPGDIFRAVAERLDYEHQNEAIDDSDKDEDEENDVLFEEVVPEEEPFIEEINSQLQGEIQEVPKITQLEMDYLKFPEIEYLSDSGRGSIASDDEIMFDAEESHDVLLEKHHSPVVQLPNGQIILKSF